MAFLDATATGYAPAAEDTKAQAPDPRAALSCARATEALEDAIRAILDDDIPGRCRAVGQATEAVTSLFLELEAGCALGNARFAGQVCEAVLTHLVHINVRNDIDAAIAAIGLLERFRDAWARSESPQPVALAARAGLTRRL